MVFSDKCLPVLVAAHVFIYRKKLTWSNIALNLLVHLIKEVRSIIHYKVNYVLGHLGESY